MLIRTIFGLEHLIRESYCCEEFSANITGFGFNRM